MFAVSIRNNVTEIYIDKNFKRDVEFTKWKFNSDLILEMNCLLSLIELIKKMHDDDKLEFSIEKEEEICENIYNNLNDIINNDELIYPNNNKTINLTFIEFVCKEFFKYLNINHTFPNYSKFIIVNSTIPLLLKLTKIPKSFIIYL